MKAGVKKMMSEPLKRALNWDQHSVMDAGGALDGRIRDYPQHKQNQNLNKAKSNGPLY